jgi:hypothetical protein
VKHFYSLVVIFSYFAVSAPSWAFEVTDQASCLDLPASTSWTSDPGIVPGNCTLNSDLTINTLDVEMRFTVSSDVTLKTNFLECSKHTCRLDNYGLIILDGSGMRVGALGLGFGGVVTNAVGAVIQNLGSITVQRSSIRNEGVIDNHGDIVLSSGGIINDGAIINGGTIRVDCAQIANNPVPIGTPATFAYCWTGSSGAPWSNASNWNRNRVVATQPPDENARIIVRGGRVSLDVDYTLRGSLAVVPETGANGGAGSDLIVEPGISLLIYGSMTVSGGDSSVVNNSFIENYGSVSAARAARVVNNGTFYNHAVVKVALINNDGGSFENGWDGEARLSLTNYSTIINAGTMKIGSASGGHRCDARPVNFARCWLNFGSITNGPGARLDILQGLWVRDDGELNNYGVVTITKRFFDVGGLIGPGLLRIDRMSNVLNASLINVGPIVQDGREAIPGTIENSGRFWNVGGISNLGSTDNQGHLCGPGVNTGNPITGIAPVLDCDSTPPEIESNSVGTIGNDGWYTSDIALSWTATDDDSQILTTSGCYSINLQNDIPGQTRICTAESFGGVGAASFTYKRDATAPTLSPVVMPDPVMQGLAAIVVANVEDPPSGSGLATFDCGPVQTSTLGPQIVTCTAEDLAGNNSMADGTYTVISPAEAADNLIEDIEDSGILESGEESLTKLLASAVAMLDRGNEKAARNKLNAFINKINARAGKSISVSDVDALIAKALLILEGIDVE